MKTIIRYNPSLTTLNMGDFIIFESVKRELDFIFNGSFNIDVSTHLPISYVFSNLLKNADYKFVCGTNLLMGHLNGIFRQWDINILNAKKLGPAILVGVGWWQYNNNPNMYTKAIYRRILSSEYQHSVRDMYTKRMLNEMGINNVICTACPTMWSLTEEHCQGIPKGMAKKVITTLTDYNCNKTRDQLMLDNLYENYDNVYIWLQGARDFKYVQSLNINDKVIIIPPSLEAYDRILENEDVDYVGTRLHGGIRALQKQVRTVIISVDNRALEKQKDFNIPVLERENIHRLPEIINSDIITDIHIPTKEISRWKRQFTV